MKRISIVLLLVVLLAACSQQAVSNVGLETQANTWQKMGGALDFTVAKDAVSPKLLLDRNGNLVVAWKEYNNGPKVYMERWTNTGWQGLAKVFPLKVDYPDYSIVFDSSNSPVIGSAMNDLTREVAVYRFDNVSKTWKQLGANFTGSSKIAADKNGFVYSVQGSTIRRWSGSSWQTVRTYQATDGSSISLFNTLSFKSDGITPVLNVSLDMYTAALAVWNGSKWERICHTYRGALASTVLDRKDQCFGYDGSLDLYQGSQPLDKFGVQVASTTFSRSNRPIATIDYGEDIIVKRWSGSAWVQLGGIVDRVATRNVNIYSASLLVDGNNTLYAAWSECVDYDAVATRCNNFNIYVSKYPL
jgi:hypothetical protein